MCVSRVGAKYDYIEGEVLLSIELYWFDGWLLLLLLLLIIQQARIFLALNVWCAPFEKTVCGVYSHLLTVNVFSFFNIKLEI